MNYDEGALHQIEEELGTTIYPGTEIMADVGTHHFVKSSAKSNRVLVPQPSQDPHDPLPVLEDERNGHYHGDIIRSGLGTSGVGTDVSSTNGII
ncbi:hypothetical protein PCG10_006183 [Penicillium crustosum]|uniref:Uncharacterized protein n=1 Tax=Penicillium crustosum TaxID=36656 RepID=A0A9P5L8I3_PENCR|nr:hypothetical protein PCG10_006183 [Penicillium crustosum]